MFSVGLGKEFTEKLITLKWKLILFNIQFYCNYDSPEVTGKPDLLNCTRDIMNMCFHLIYSSVRHKFTLPTVFGFFFFFGSIRFHSNWVMNTPEKHQGFFPQCFNGHLAQILCCCNGFHELKKSLKEAIAVTIAGL